MIVVAATVLFGCCCWEYWRVMRWLTVAIGEGPCPGSVGSVKNPLDNATDRHQISGVEKRT